MRRLRRIRARPRRRPPRLLRPLRASAPRPGVGRDRDLRGRPHHDDARLRPRLPGLRRGEAEGARGRHGDRPRPLLDHRRRLLGERAAGLARRRPRAGARPQRQPDQRGRALERAEGERDRLPRHLRLGDHRGAALLQRGPLHRGRGRRRDAAARGRLLDRGDDQARDRRLPRPARGAAALARTARRPLRRRLGELRLRHHRRRAAARGAARRDGLADRARPRDPPGRHAPSGPPTASSSTSTSPAPTAGSRARSCSRCAGGWARSSGARRRSRPTS